MALAGGQGRGQVVSGAKQISQFLDRDTRPDFASTVMIQSIQDFIGNPKDVDGLCNSIQRQKKTIFSQPVGWGHPRGISLIAA